MIQQAVAIILPSRIDNFPNTCLEAMYFGKIVVGTRGTSFEGIIEDGVSGFLCLPDNQESLLTVTRKVLGLSHEQRERISENAKIRVAKLSPERVVPKLIAFYESVLQHNGCAKRSAFAKTP
jgi:glycosyltransferase involved in cell wall biosynthesis